MTLSLVSEARPIPWKRLSVFEQKALKEADAWMAEVIKDGNRDKSGADEIDALKSGRVLFIGGSRGAGKTSFLLTLLEYWSGDKEKRKIYGDETVDPKNVHILRPVLDFDPLPHGMPVHGWLLEPWRKQVDRLEEGSHGGGGETDLKELWADVFERSVLGWSAAAVEGKGIVDKAMAYAEQASGWIDTRTLWYKMVNSAVCRSCNCKKAECKAKHEAVFVIAIDDVDLQVEQVPKLLHAIRLLHHPNVVYVLTGDKDHLRFVMELDYIRRHSAHLGDVLRPFETGSARENTVSARMESYSRRLREALVEKALPQHAVLELPTLSLEMVLGMRVGDDNVGGKFTSKKQWMEIVESTKELKVVTARCAQHAIDRAFGSDDHVETPSVNAFMADICGTSTDAQDDKRVVLRGQLTTKLGPIYRRWNGDRLSIQLRERPKFEFEPDSERAEQGSDEEGNRAAIIQLAVEKDVLKADGLHWSPDAGVALTEVRWGSTADSDEVALFHWPWLLRPTVSEVLGFAKTVERMKFSTVDIADRANLGDGLILAWLQENIRLQLLRNGKNDSDVPQFKNLAEVGATMKGQWEASGSESSKEELKRWCRELAVMTAPFFGLPDDPKIKDVATELREKVCLVVLRLAYPDTQGEMKDAAGTLYDALEKEQRDTVGNAILSGRMSARGGSLGIVGTEPNLEAEVTEFLETRKDMAPKNKWWAFLDQLKKKPIRRTKPA